MSIERRIRVARGDARADLLLRHARIVNVCSGEIYAADVAIADGRIAAIGEGYHGEQERDLGGRYLVPGLVDGHMHLESTMLTMPEFARTVVPRGTTTVVIDPHEFANVLGVAGIRYAIDSARGLPLNVYAMLSSCVPASPLESPSCPLLADDLLPLLDDPAVLGLAEMMDVPGVLEGQPDVLAKIGTTRARGRVVDGHAPALTGRTLNGYAAAGIMSDHESTTIEEAREKLRLGMWLMVRDGSTTRNLETLLPLLAELRPPRALFVTDDRDPVDLTTRGHIDSMVRASLAYGLDPIEVLRLASYNAAQYFGLRDLGAIVPGYRADLLVVDDLRTFDVTAVYKDGALVAEEGTARFSAAEASHDGPEGLTGTVHVAPMSSAHLRLAGLDGAANVIGVDVGQATTTWLSEQATAQDGCLVADTTRDLLKVAVVERHHASGRIGLGLVTGFGLRTGALASSVAHDAHNVVVVGVGDDEMVAAVSAIQEMGGGFVVVADGAVRAALPLPIAGLVSPEPVETLVARLVDVDRAAAALGCTLEHPFMTLSFLSLSVIPSLKLTDHGLVDVAAARLAPVQPAARL